MNLANNAAKTIHLANVKIRIRYYNDNQIHFFDENNFNEATNTTIKTAPTDTANNQANPNSRTNMA